MSATAQSARENGLDYLGFSVNQRFFNVLNAGAAARQWGAHCKDIKDAGGGSLPEEDPDGDGTAVSFNLHYPGQYYDAETGRYLTPDPIGLDGALARYVYANENLVMYMDWDGRIAPVYGASVIWGCFTMGAHSMVSSIANEGKHGFRDFVLSCGTGAIGFGGATVSATASIARIATNMCLGGATIALSVFGDAATGK